MNVKYTMYTIFFFVPVHLAILLLCVSKFKLVTSKGYVAC